MESRVVVDYFFLNCGGRGYQLKGGTRFVSITHKRISPKAEKVFVLIVCRHFVIFFLVFCERLRCIVWVITRSRCTCQHISGLRIHYKAHDAVRFCLFHAFFESLFNIILNCFVKGHYNIQSVLCFVVFLGTLHKFIAQKIGVLYPSSGYSAQILVILQFNPRTSHVIVVDTSQHLGRKIAERIIPLRVFGKLDSRNFELTELICSLFVKIFCNSYKSLIFLHVFIDFIGVLIDDSCDFSCKGLDFAVGSCLAFFEFDLRWSRPQRITGRARRKFLSVSVVYRAALCFYRRVLCLLVNRLLAQLFGINDLYPCHSEHKRNQEQCKNCKAQCDSSSVFYRYLCSHVPPSNRKPDFMLVLSCLAPFHL